VTFVVRRLLLRPEQRFAAGTYAKVRFAWLQDGTACAFMSRGRSRPKSYRAKNLAGSVRDSEGKQGADRLRYAVHEICSRVKKEFAPYLESAVARRDVVGELAKEEFRSCNRSQ